MTCDSVLVFGETGPLAGELFLRRGRLAPLASLVCLDRPRIDLADAAAVAEAIGHLAPRVVINAAPYAGIRGLEGRPELAFAINSGVPAAMAEACARLGAPLLHVSAAMMARMRGDGVAPGVLARAAALGEVAIRRHLPATHVILRPARHPATAADLAEALLSLARAILVGRPVRWGTFRHGAAPSSGHSGQTMPAGGKKKEARGEAGPLV